MWTQATRDRMATSDPRKNQHDALRGWAQRGQRIKVKAPHGRCRPRPFVNRKRGSSYKPAIRRSTKRQRHSPTVTPSRPRLTATLLVLAAFRAGQHNPRPQGQCPRRLRRHVNAFSCDRSSSLSTKGRQSPTIDSSIAANGATLTRQCESTANLMLRTSDSGHQQAEELGRTCKRSLIGPRKCV
jgi:hypothetical protein